jgi:hypothetical protein
MVMKPSIGGMKILGFAMLYPAYGLSNIIRKPAQKTEKNET